jgi:hypothetical protein
LLAEVEGFLTSVREDWTWGVKISEPQTTDGECGYIKMCHYWQATARDFLPENAARRDMTM